MKQTKHLKAISEIKVKQEGSILKLLRRTNQTELETEMTFKILTAVALATTVFAVSTAAEAGKRHGGGFKKHRNFHHGGHIRYHDHWGGGYGYYEPANCHYFFRKARYTGSRYWWKKYRICISRY